MKKHAESLVILAKRAEIERLRLVADGLSLKRAYTAQAGVERDITRLVIEVAQAEEVAAENAKTRTPLQIIRSMRIRAQQDGSHTAASVLAGQERELVEAERVERERKRLEREAALATHGDEAVAELVDAVLELDDIAAERVFVALSDRRRARFRG